MQRIDRDRHSLPAIRALSVAPPAHRVVNPAKYSLFARVCLAGHRPESARGHLLRVLTSQARRCRNGPKQRRENKTRHSHPVAVAERSPCIRGVARQLVRALRLVSPQREVVATERRSCRRLRGRRGKRPWKLVLREQELRVQRSRQRRDLHRGRRSRGRGKSLASANPVRVNL